LIYALRYAGEEVAINIDDIEAAYGIIDGQGDGLLLLSI